MSELPVRWNHPDEYDSIFDDYEARKQTIRAEKLARTGIPSGPDRFTSVMKVGKKGFIHGWIYMGGGDKITHPDHGEGKITGTAGVGRKDTAYTAEFKDGTKGLLGDRAPTPDSVPRKNYSIHTYHTDGTETDKPIKAIDEYDASRQMNDHINQLKASGNDKGVAMVGIRDANGNMA